MREWLPVLPHTQKWAFDRHFTTRINSFPYSGLGVGEGCRVSPRRHGFRTPRQLLRLWRFVHGERELPGSQRPTSRRENWPVLDRCDHLSSIRLAQCAGWLVCHKLADHLHHADRLLQRVQQIDKSATRKGVALLPISSCGLMPTRANACGALSGHRLVQRLLDHIGRRRPRDVEFGADGLPSGDTQHVLAHGHALRRLTMR